MLWSTLHRVSSRMYTHKRIIEGHFNASAQRPSKLYFLLCAYGNTNTKIYYRALSTLLRKSRECL